MIIDRPYQTEAVHSFYNYFQKKSGNPLIAMPTGTGKSIVLARIIESVYRYYPNQRVMMLTHVKELIEQNFSKLLSVWPQAPAGIYSAGLGKKESQFPITFAGIGSVAKKAHLFGRIDLVFVDEAHLVSPNDETMYRTLISALLEVNPLLKVIGLTATPWRIGQGRLTAEGGLFTDICYDITGMEAFHNLILEGYLAPLVPRAMSTTIDTGTLHMRGGEFVPSEVQLAVDKEEITYAAIQEMLELGADRKHWLIFAAGVEHAIHIADMLKDYGITAEAVHSSLSKEERDKRIGDFKSGKLRAVVNNNVLTTGFDYPEIDLIGMLRPTASIVLWVQMLGRGTRPVYASGYDLNTTEGRLGAIAASEKQNCLVLDFAGNTKRLGPINDPVLPRPKGKGGGEAPVKECPMCSVINHASVRTCMKCDYEFIFQTKITTTSSTKELIKGDIPVTEEFAVDHVTYHKHQRAGRPATLQVSYHCGYRLFKEYVCLEHEGGVANKARRWWKDCAGSFPPETVTEALVRSAELRSPIKIRVWTNKQYPEIINRLYNEEFEDVHSH